MTTLGWFRTGPDWSWMVPVSVLQPCNQSWTSPDPGLFKKGKKTRPDQTFKHYSCLSILFLTNPVTTPPFHISVATQWSPFVQSDMYTPALWVYLDAITTLPDNGRNLACPTYALWIVFESPVARLAKNQQQDQTENSCNWTAVAVLRVLTLTWSSYNTFKDNWKTSCKMVTTGLFVYWK